MKYQNPHLEFNGKRFQVYTVEENIHGKKIRRDLVTHPGAVVILPFLDENTILMIENERFSVGKKLIELPAGTLEKNEPPITCAHRELEEETGYIAQEIKPLLQFYASPGFCNEVLYVFVAKGLTKTAQKLDPTERITVKEVVFEKALEMVREGIICDAKSISTLLYYSQFKFQ